MKAIIWMALAACGGGGTSGGGDGNGGLVDAKLIAGGGVADAPIAGTLHVYAVELDSATPIAGASISLAGAPGAITTDATGLATFTGVTGPQTVSAVATGHAAVTWIGVAGANATLPLEPAPRVVPTAHVTGTITGFGSLPSPSFGHYTLAVILYSFLDDPGAPENSIAQPMSGTTPLDTCLDTGLSSSCAWQLNTRIGPQLHTAVIVDGDTHGTSSDTSDDTYTLIGYAAGQPMTLTANQQVTNEALAMVSGTTPLAVTLPAAPAGLAHVVAIPELALGAPGRIVFPLPTLSPTATSTQVLAPTGAFAGHYELVALATASATATTPYSSAFVHDVSGTAAVPAWLAAPTVTAGASFTFTASGDLHTAQLSRAGQTLWDVSVLDGSTSFTLPQLTPDPLGTGSFVFAFTNADVPGFDPAHFDVPTAKTTLARAAGAQTTFTR